MRTVTPARVIAVVGSDQRDIYLVAPDGSALLLPASVRASLRY